MTAAPFRFTDRAARERAEEQLAPAACRAAATHVLDPRGLVVEGIGADLAGGTVRGSVEATISGDDGQAPRCFTHSQRGHFQGGAQIADAFSTRQPPAPGTIVSTTRFWSTFSPSMATFRRYWFTNSSSSTRSAPER